MEKKGLRRVWRCGCGVGEILMRWERTCVSLWHAGHCCQAGGHYWRYRAWGGVIEVKVNEEALLEVQGTWEGVIGGEGRVEGSIWRFPGMEEATVGSAAW